MRLPMPPDLADVRITQRPVPFERIAKIHRIACNIQ